MTAQQVVEGLYQAFGTGDMDALGRLLDDCHWVEASGGPYGGTYKGFGEVAENVFGKIAADVSGFSARPDELLCIGDDRVLALGRYRGSTGAGPLDIRFAHLWTVSGDKISHFEQFTDTGEWKAAVA